MRSPPFEPSARNKDGKVKPDEANGSSSSSTVGGQKILHDVVEDWGDQVWMSADQRAREAEMQWRMVGRSESDADAIRAFQRATEAYRVKSETFPTGKGRGRRRVVGAGNRRTRLGEADNRAVSGEGGGSGKRGVVLCRGGLFPNQKTFGVSQLSTSVDREPQQRGREGEGLRVPGALECV